MRKIDVVRYIDSVFVILDAAAADTVIFALRFRAGAVFIDAVLFRAAEVFIFYFRHHFSFLEWISVTYTCQPNCKRTAERTWKILV